MTNIDIKEEIINGVHILIPIIVMSFVLLPVKILKYVWFLPAFFIHFGGFDGCFLTKMSKKHRKNNNWALDQMKKYINKNAKDKDCWYLIGIWICLSIILSAFKLINFKNK